MQFSLITLILVLLVNIRSLLSVIVTPNNNPDPQNVAVDLRTDPRGINKVNAAGQWFLDQDNTPPGILKDWALVTTLSESKYGFNAGSSDSRLAFTLAGSCVTSQCDAYFGFSFGSADKYAVYAIDFDGGYRAKLQPSPQGPQGIFAYPACNSAAIEQGPLSIEDGMKGQENGNDDVQRIRNAMVGGNPNDWGLVTSDMNGKTFPVKFELINDDVNGAFTVKFSSATTSFTCTYGSAAPTNGDINVYFSPDDARDEQMKVDSLEFESCDTDQVGQSCSSDDECSSCLHCCQASTCKPRPVVSPAKSILNEVQMDAIGNMNKNNTNNYGMYGYILLIGVIAFILVNNIFIGCWCLQNKNKPRYVKCDDIAIDE